MDMDIVSLQGLMIYWNRVGRWEASTVVRRKEEER